MISLPNNCSCSELTVNPKNWKTCKANGMARNWHIQYYFYDLTVKKRKFVIIKGMNRFKTLAERREATAQLIENELRLLKSECFNPILNKYVKPSQLNFAVEPTTDFITALLKAVELVKVVPEMRDNIKSTMKYIEQAAKQLGFAKLEIQTIRRRHLKLLLQQCAQIKDKWTASTFNHYRTNLMVLFKELVEQDAIDINPVKEISKEKEVQLLRTVLTTQQRKDIDDYLRDVNPDYRRFVHIFFHSGCRKTELIQLKGADVDTQKQFFKFVLKKGKQQKEVLKPIKDIALPFWHEQLANCKPDDFVFGQNFKPNTRSLRSQQISKKWKKYVKDDLKIKIDFYALKHLNLDEISTILDAEAAAKMAGHKSTVITLKHYLVNEKERKMEKLKKVNNDFA